MSDSPRLLYFCPVAEGGLAEYARQQANALAGQGLDVEVLTTADWRSGPGDRFRTVAALPAPDFRPRFRWARRLASARRNLATHRRFADAIATGRHTHVLCAAYAEYLAPCWAGRLVRFARRGVVFGTVVHDPVRDFAIGPAWWHRRSIAAGYSFVREAFVHEPGNLDTGGLVPGPRVTVIPHGIYDFPPAAVSREEFRRRLGIPADAPLWLAFGHIRDGKNLGLVVRALAQFPDAWLIVAGREQSSGQKPLAHYRALAEAAGVAARCRWHNEFIPAAAVSDYFNASDLVLLTYSATFRSASGVLSAAAFFRKPCLASSGAGPLRRRVQDYGLGIWVEPDNEAALVTGLSRLRDHKPRPRWDDFVADHSWTRNAELVRERLFASDDSNRRSASLPQKLKSGTPPPIVTG